MASWQISSILGNISQTCQRFQRKFLLKGCSQPKSCNAPRTLLVFWHLSTTFDNSNYASQHISILFSPCYELCLKRHSNSLWLQALFHCPGQSRIKNTPEPSRNLTSLALTDFKKTYVETSKLETRIQVSQIYLNCLRVTAVNASLSGKGTMLVALGLRQNWKSIDSFCLIHLT